MLRDEVVQPLLVFELDTILRRAGPVGAFANLASAEHIYIYTLYISRRTTARVIGHSKQRAEAGVAPHDEEDIQYRLAHAHPKKI